MGEKLSPLSSYAPDVRKHKPVFQGVFFKLLKIFNFEIYFQISAEGIKDRREFVYLFIFC